MLYPTVFGLNLPVLLNGWVLPFLLQQLKPGTSSFCVLDLACGS